MGAFALLARLPDSQEALMTSKQSWEPMRLTEVGTIADVVHGGGGKLSIIAADVGDVRKPKGQG